jgi:translation initiation factor IF-2
MVERTTTRCHTGLVAAGGPGASCRFEQRDGRVPADIRVTCEWRASSPATGVGPRLGCAPSGRWSPACPRPRVARLWGQGGRGRGGTRSATGGEGLAVDDSHPITRGRRLCPHPHHPERGRRRIWRTQPERQQSRSSDSDGGSRHAPVAGPGRPDSSGGAASGSSRMGPGPSGARSRLGNRKGCGESDGGWAGPGWGGGWRTRGGPGRGRVVILASRAVSRPGPG